MQVSLENLSQNHNTQPYNIWRKKYQSISSRFDSIFLLFISNGIKRVVCSKKIKHEENLENPSKYVEFKGRKLFSLKSRGKFFIWYKRESESDITKMVERILEEEKSTDIIPGRFMPSSNIFAIQHKRTLPQTFLEKLL